MVTLEKLSQLIGSSALWRDAKKNLDFLIKYSEKDSDSKKAVDDFLKTMQQAYDKASHMMGNIYFLEKNLWGHLLGWTDMPTDVHDFFPVPIYVSSGQDDENTVGIMLFEDGKKELFEGNDEASDETYKIVNELLGIGEKWTKVYGMHGERLVELIERRQEIPEGIYVSPRRDVAEGYWSLNEQRYLFSCEIQEKNVKKESDIDWKTMNGCLIRKFLIL